MLEPTEYCPAGHALQTVEPVISFDRPGAQPMHTAAQLDPENMPMGHALQPDSPCPPAVYVPTAQQVHAGWPVVLNLPAGQVSQEQLVPIEAVNFPEGQLRHAVLSVLDTSPTLQPTQIDAPSFWDI